MGAIILISLLLFFFSGLSIALSMVFASLIPMLISGVPLLAIPQRMVLGVDSYPLLAVPLFLLAGNLMNTSGVTYRLFGFAKALVGHWKGGLGHVNIIASLIFSGISGSAVADAAGLGAIEIKAMKDDGYDAGFAAGITAASSTIGPIFPPSVLMVVYATMAEQSTARMFLGGVVPALLMAVTLMIITTYISHRRNYPTRPRLGRSEFLKAFLGAIPPILTPVIILGGMFGGVFTPTEAAGVAALYAFCLGMFFYKELKWKDLPKIFLDTAVTTAVIMITLAGASIMGWVATWTQMIDFVTNSLLSVSQSPWIILLLINGLLLLLGCFVNAVPLLLILVPILLPIIVSIGIDPVHFGVMMCFNLVLGMITPPVGVCLYAVARVAQMPFERVAKETIPFLIPLVIVLLIITLVPDFTLFLPNLVMGR